MEIVSLSFEREKDKEKKNHTENKINKQQKRIKFISRQKKEERK